MKKQNNLLTLAPIFQSGMVLQREKPIVIWGCAPAGTTVTIQLDYPAEQTPDTAGRRAADTEQLSEGTHTEVSPNGTWRCTLSPQDAGENYRLTVLCSSPDTEPLVLENVSIGDVWLAGGQSNMEFFLRYDADWENVRKYDKNPQIHMYNVPQLAFAGHAKDTAGYGFWFTEGEPGFDSFSAPGYSFARNIQPHLQVPIGIIGCNWGGTTATAWLDESCLSKEPLNVYLQEYEAAVKEYTPEKLEELSLKAWKFEDSPQHCADFMPLLYGRDRAWQEDYMKKHENDPVIPMGPWNINRPGGLYHEMLESLIPFSIKGVLWYQGESDSGHADIYDQLMEALITCWRGQWKDDFPFLFVQLAPFGVWLDCDSKGYTQVRQKQELVSKTVPHTGMVSIMDIGSYYDIHPKQKMEVGRRLALLARGKVYGEDILCESPEFLSAERTGQTITLQFRNGGALHCIEDAPISGFVLQQQDKEVPIDSVVIQDETIVLRVDALTADPCTVDFAWADYAVVNVHNSAGLPIKPFQCEL